MTGSAHPVYDEISLSSYFQVVTGILCYVAVERIITKNFEIEPTIMLYTSLFGLVVNVL